MNNNKDRTKRMQVVTDIQLNQFARVCFLKEIVSLKKSHPHKFPLADSADTC